jgi:hypothetical protein
MKAFNVTELQKRQRQWAWNKAQIRNCTSQLRRIEVSLGAAVNDCPDFERIKDELNAANDWVFQSNGGTIRNVGGVGYASYANLKRRIRKWNEKPG